MGTYLITLKHDEINLSERLVNRKIEFILDTGDFSK